MRIYGPLPHFRPPKRIFDDLMPAERLLVALCRSDGFDLDDIPGLHSFDARQLYHDLVAGSVRHHVDGLVFSTLQRSPAGKDLFAHDREQVSRSLSRITRRAGLWDLEQDRVLGAVQSAGFQPLLLKGGALRRWVYKAPVERAMSDLDILVTPGEVPDVLAVLRTLGYESEYSETAREGFKAHLYHDRVAHAQGFYVEVHWGLTRPAGSWHLDADLFLERSHLLERPGAPKLRVPSPEDMILHTVGQSHQGGVRQLRRLVDLDRVIGSEPLDWDYVLAQAEEANLYATLCITHRLAGLLLGTPAPHELLEGRGLSRTGKHAIAWMRPVRRVLREPKWEWLADDSALLHLWCLPGWRERTRAFLAVGVRDPLGWIWKGLEHPEEEPGRGGGLRVVAKLVAQAVLMLSYFWVLFVFGGRNRLRFWKNEA